MNMSCFAWEGEKRNEDGIMWFENERCIALDSDECSGCRFYKNRDSVTKHTFKWHGKEITEWIPNEHKSIFKTVR